MNSIEKVKSFWSEHGATVAGSPGLAAAAYPVLVQRIGEDPAGLDLELLRIAGLCLALRSDDADPVRLEPDPFTESETADAPADTAHPTA